MRTKRFCSQLIIARRNVERRRVLSAKEINLWWMQSSARAAKMTTLSMKLQKNAKVRIFLCLKTKFYRSIKFFSTMTRIRNCKTSGINAAQLGIKNVRDFCCSACITGKIFSCSNFASLILFTFHYLSFS